MHEHDGYAPHSHEVRPDHLGVKQEPPVAENPRQAAEYMRLLDGESVLNSDVYRAWRITKRLAECDAPRDGEYGECRLCDGKDSCQVYVNGKPERLDHVHKVGCPWIDARELHGIDASERQDHA